MDLPIYYQLLLTEVLIILSYHRSIYIGESRKQVNIGKVKPLLDEMLVAITTEKQRHLVGNGEVLGS